MIQVPQDRKAQVGFADAVQDRTIGRMPSFLRHVLLLGILSCILGCSDSGSGPCMDSNGGSYFHQVSGSSVTDLQAVSEFTCLGSISISRTEVTDLSPLSGLPNLVYISLRSNPRLEKIAPLAGVRALKHLTINGGGQLVDFGSLKEALRLEELDLEAIDFVRPDTLAQFIGLRWLSLRNTGMDTLTPLRALVNLRNLYLIDLSAKDNAFVTELEKLETYFCSDTPLNSLEPLRNKTGMKHVTSLNCGVTDLEPLRGKAGITFLQISEKLESSEFELLPSVLGKGDTLRASTNTAFPGHVPAEIVAQLTAAGVKINP